MSIVRNELEGEAPDGPHLAVVTDHSGNAMAIPVGATVLLVTDPTKPTGVTPMLLAKVSRTSLIFRCACQRPKCTRVLRYVLKAEGHHPSIAG